MKHLDHRPTAPSVPSAKFDAGRIVATPGALNALSRSGEDVAGYLARHLAGDWGDVPPEDALENDVAVSQGSRVLSAYRLADGTALWVITEADRSSTCLLLPDEY
jgi:hypothetical protein